MQNIPLEDYKKILETMPICCVDIVIHQGEKVLLVYRKNEPAKNQWWLPGGRLLKNEKLEAAAKRKAFEELGMEVKVERMIGVYEVMFDKGPFDDLKSNIHDVAICFLVQPKDKNYTITIDSTSSNYRWINRIEEGLDIYVKRILTDSKLFN